MFKRFIFRILILPFIIININADIDIDIQANNIKQTEHTTILEGNVSANILNYKIKSNKSIYNTKKNTFTLEDKVSLENENMFITSRDAVINTKQNTINANKVLITDKETKLWIKSRDASICNQIYSLNDAKLSSCNEDNPAWNINFTKGSYDANDKNFYLNNVVLRLYSVPILYSPYLVLPNKVRQSGLLAPDFSISSKEFSYMQTMYINIDNSQDLEIKPHIRTRKGYGVNSIYRLAMDKNSFINAKASYFKYNQGFKDELEIDNDSVYGYEIDYNMNIENDGYKKQKLLLGLKSFNDINYEVFKTLKTSKSSYSINAVSKAGYIATNKDFYFDIYLKNFKNMNKKESDQILPQINIHKNIDNLFFNRLYYLVDFKSTHYTRVNKISLFSNEIEVPIIYNTDLLYDYLNFEISDNFYSSYKYYYIEDSSDSATYNRNHYEIKLSSDLVKQYNNFFHNTKMWIKYVSLEHEDGFSAFPTLDNSDSNNPKFVYNSKQLNDKLELNIDNYFYNNSNKLILHKLKSIANLSSEEKEVDVLNDISFWATDKINIKNQINYSLKDEIIDKVLSFIEYDYNQDILKLNHIYDIQDNKESNYLRIDSKKKITDEYSLLMDIDFNQRDYHINRWGIGIEKDTECFAYNVKLSKNASSLLSKTHIKSFKETVLYFKINLKPLGGFEQKYESI